MPKVDFIKIKNSGQDHLFIIAWISPVGNCFFEWVPQYCTSSGTMLHRLRLPPFCLGWMRCILWRVCAWWPLLLAFLVLEAVYLAWRAPSLKIIERDVQKWFILTWIVGVCAVIEVVWEPSMMQACARVCNLPLDVKTTLTQKWLPTIQRDKACWPHLCSSGEEGWR